MTREEMIKYLTAQQEVADLFAAKEYGKAAEKCLEVTKDYPWDSGGYYNLACAYARLGKTQGAMDALKSAIAQGYDESGHMKADPDLESLHKADGWDDLVKQARKNELTGPWEKGPEFKGVKTLEDFPEGGLRYRLRMSPDATKDKPNKLIIWLHPSGGSANMFVENEAMLKMFLDNNFALLVFTKKSWAGWMGEDAAKMLNVDLPAISKIEGIDVRRPILIGFSAGGQMALNLYNNADKFGGMVLDAAYPIVQSMSPEGQLTQTQMEIKKTDAIKSMPMLVYVGQQDNGAKLWKQLEPKWLELGVPLTVVYCENAKHEWMLHQKRPAERQILADWLQQVSKGKLPASQPATQPATQPAQ